MPFQDFLRVFNFANLGNSIKLHFIYLFTIFQVVDKKSKKKQHKKLMKDIDAITGATKKRFFVYCCLNNLLIC